MGEIPFGDPFAQPPGTQTQHVNVQELPAFAVVVAIGLTVLPQETSQCPLHLLHILWGAGGEGITDGRLFRTAGATKGALQRRVRAQTGVDFDYALSAR